MFTAYFDASGDSHSQLVLVVAGFVAHADQWKEWESEWLGKLQEYGLKDFYMTELRKRLTRRQQSRLIEDLRPIITSNAARKFGVAVVNRNIRSRLSQRAQKKWRMNAYSVAGRTCAAELRQWASRWGGRIPEMVFEDGDKGKGDLIHMLESQGYPSPIFKPKRSYIHKKSGTLIEAAVQLQAADLLAYEIFSIMRDVLKSTDQVVRKQHVLCREFENMPGDWGFVEPDRYRFIEQGLEQKDSLIMTTDVKINTQP